MPTQTLAGTYLSTQGGAWSPSVSGRYLTSTLGSFDSAYIEYSLADFDNGSKIPLSVRLVSLADNNALPTARIEAALVASGSRVDDPGRFPMSATLGSFETVTAWEWAGQPGYVPDQNAAPRQLLAWPASMIDDLRVRFWMAEGTSVEVGSVQLEVTYVTIPTTTILNVVGLDSRYPSPYVQLEDGDTGKTILPAAPKFIVYADGATDANGVAAGGVGFEVDSHLSPTPVVQASAVLSGWPPVVGPLDDGDYWVYARAGVRTTSGVVFSEWDSAQFTVAAAGVSTPTVTAVAEPEFGRVRLDVVADAPNLLTYVASTASDLLLFEPKNIKYWQHGSPPVGGGGLDDAIEGLRDLRFTQDGDSPFEVVCLEAIPVTPGEVYSAEVWSYIAFNEASPPDTRVDIDWLRFDPNGSSLNAAGTIRVSGPGYTLVSTSEGADTADNGATHRVSVASQTCPAGATHARIALRGVSSLDGDIFHADQFGFYNGPLPSAWSYGDAPSAGVAPTGAIIVERTLAGEATFSQVDAVPIGNDSGTIKLYDRNVPPGYEFEWRVHINRSTGVSNWSGLTDPVELTHESWWLRSLTDPSMDTELHPTSYTDETAEQITVLDPIDRDLPVLLTSGRRGVAGQVTALVRTDLERTRLKALFESSSNLMIVDNLGNAVTMRPTTPLRWSQVRSVDLARRRVKGRWLCSFGFRQTA